MVPRLTAATRIAATTLGILALCYVVGSSCQRARKPVTITFLDLEWDVRDRLPGLAQDLRDFTQETGILVNRLPGPDGSLNQLALWRELLPKRGGSPDVCNIDAIWAGILNQYLMDLRPDFSSDLFSKDPVVIGSYTMGAKLVAIPHHAYVGSLLYRADLLQQYGYDRPPRTWDELEMMASRIQACERAKGKKDFWGFVWAAAESEDLTCMGLEWQKSQGGGRIIEEDGTVSVNNPQTIRAWERAVHWKGSISPPGVVVYGKWDDENLWGGGKAAFHRGWVSEYSLVALPVPPAGAPAFGATSLPAGPAGW
jgi:trehalose/maltose transport system substrate-binding protein